MPKKSKILIFKRKCQQMILKFQTKRIHPVNPIKRVNKNNDNNNVRTKAIMLKMEMLMEILPRDRYYKILPYKILHYQTTEIIFLLTFLSEAALLQ